MPEQPFTFQDFGMLPADEQQPPEKVRCFFSTRRTVGQFVSTGVVSALGVGLAVVFALLMPLPQSLLGCVAALAGFGAIVYMTTRNDHRCVELDGNTLRAQHFYTGRTIARSVDEIESVGAMVGNVKGFEIRFRDRRTSIPIALANPVMINGNELFDALLYRMAQVGELEVTTIDFRGQRLWRNIHWKGEQPHKPWKRELVLLTCLMCATLAFGAILGFVGLQDQERHEVGSLPPHEVALSSLIQNGPGTNRHVTITDFRPGGYYFEGDPGSWREVYVALFPIGEARPTEIKAVLSTKEVRDEAGLRQLLQHGHFTGICSKGPSSHWGTTLGPELVKANEGCPLLSAWSIDELDKLSEVPSAASVARSFAESTGCLLVALICAAIIFWKAA